MSRANAGSALAGVAAALLIGTAPVSPDGDWPEAPSSWVPPSRKMPG